MRQSIADVVSGLGFIVPAGSDRPELDDWLQAEEEKIFKQRFENRGELGRLLTTNGRMTKFGRGRRFRAVPGKVI
jgi:hypothetical protein